jgi:hypothetical protein
MSSLEVFFAIKEPRAIWLRVFVTHKMQLFRQDGRATEELPACERQQAQGVSNIPRRHLSWGVDHRLPGTRSPTSDDHSGSGHAVLSLRPSPHLRLPPGEL